ncbi:hypothetical protein [Allonocardiopsis opalescens]|uniref:Uncharacterized protein n=1 Tax=Allonocardiopsis opalescens TaxID=1144618 RepID=A0A2T0Q002_9ACTN|nr:hypothetical protein [Allonocardiopsis opalescens]PRX97120.1 hypothetical protein CLV72_106156 [Allonocardiopsis opalescens]
MRRRHRLLALAAAVALCAGALWWGDRELARWEQERPRRAQVRTEPPQLRAMVAEHNPRSTDTDADWRRHRSIVIADWCDEPYGEEHHSAPDDAFWGIGTEDWIANTRLVIAVYCPARLDEFDALAD